jgi:hypothetical protein
VAAATVRVAAFGVSAGAGRHRAEDLVILGDGVHARAADLDQLFTW